MNATIVSGGITFVLGIAVTWMALTLPTASVGIPYAPKVFPAGLGILILGLSAFQVVKEFSRVKKAQETHTRERDPYLKPVLLTCVAALLYALVFKRIGYVPATFLFLQAELWLFGGESRNWKVNTLVSILFSVGIYLLFAKALGVYLPRIPYLWI
jgi:putative tricarboxylic transport membrane protein